MLVVAAVAAAARPAGAAGWEVTLSAGRVFPFYNQSFAYDPGPLAPPIPGATLEQRGVFTLDARGGLALNLAVARALPAIQENLARQVESRLEPVVFNPTFFHASVGIALRF